MWDGTGFIFKTRNLIIRFVMIEELLKKLETENIVIIKETEYHSILENVRILKEVDTLFSGYIRILLVAHTLLTQEQTPKAEIIIRKAASRESAENFLNDRLKIYERMWDGCGCKVDYYH